MYNIVKYMSKNPSLSVFSLNFYYIIRYFEVYSGRKIRFRVTESLNYFAGEDKSLLY